MSRRILLSLGLCLAASTALAATPPARTAPAHAKGAGNGSGKVAAKPAQKAAAKPAQKATAKPARKATAKAGAKSSGARAAPKLPALTAEKIVQRNVAARGGLTAWRSVETLTMSGQLDAGGKPTVELPFVMKLKRGHKSRLEIPFNGKTAVQVYDGTRGWKVRPFLNRNEVEPYTEAEARSAAGWAELDGPLIDHERKGTKVRLAGTEVVDGKPAYELELTFRNGERRHLWIDGKTFLERKIDGEPRKLDGKLRPVAIHYREFRTENGLTTPRVLETAAEGVPQHHTLKIERVVVNAPVDDALFGKPKLAVASVGR